MVLCVRHGEGCPAHHFCEGEARAALRGLVESEAVRAALVAEVAGWCNDVHALCGLDAILAALAEAS